MPQIDNGERIDLRNYYQNISRRNFMSSVVGTAAGGLALNQLVKEAYGAEPEGKVIVHTRDRSGKPAIVESVDPKRYRRIKTFSEFKPRNINNPHINGASIRQRSESRTDLAIQIGVKPEAVGKGMSNGNGKPKPEDIPGQTNLPENPREIPGVQRALGRAKKRAHASTDQPPVEYKVVGSDMTPQALEGGSSLSREHDGGHGTVGVVGWDESTEKHVLLTAYHVWSGSHGLTYDGYSINDVMYTSPQDYENFNGQDAITLDISDKDFFYDVKDANEIPGINGYWTYDGLTNATSGWGSSNVDAQAYGHTSGKISDSIDDTHKETSASGLEYLAHTEHDPGASGDSGCPWVDNDGYMFGHHVGEHCGVDCWHVISVAEPAFNSVNFTLDPDGSGSTK